MNPADFSTPDLEVLLRYATALAIGLLMGLERERNPAARAGLRTFALTALFGVLAAHLGQRRIPHGSSQPVCYWWAA